MNRRRTKDILLLDEPELIRIVPKDEKGDEQICNFQDYLIPTSLITSVTRGILSILRQAHILQQLKNISGFFKTLVSKKKKNNSLIICQ